MSLLAILKGRGANGFGYGTTAAEVTAGIDLTGKTMLVTGCNSGIGLETTRTLLMRGARVIGTGRTLERARLVGAALSGDFVAVACELSDPVSVRACVDTITSGPHPLDAVICNAGIMALPRLTQAHGVELQFFTNHIGHFMLVTGLLRQLTPQGRVVVVSSEAHRGAPPEGIQFDNLSGEKSYSPWKAYGQSKLANLLFTKELARRMGTAGRMANALHPGVIATNLVRSMPAVARVGWKLASPLVLKTTAQGAATTCYLATNPAVSTQTGGYYADCNPAQPRPIANDAALAARLWVESERIVASLP